MEERKLRVLYAATHPIQYLSPILRRMACHPRLDLTVAYCSLEGAEKSVDADFGVDVAWDVPLLDGYPWVQVPNRSLRPGLGRSLGLVNPGLWNLVRNGRFDAVITQIGYNYASFWILVAAAREMICAPDFYRQAVLERVRPKLLETMSREMWWARFMEVTGL